VYIYTRSTLGRLFFIISRTLFAKSLILLRPGGGEFIAEVIYKGSDFMTDSFVSIVITSEMRLPCPAAARRQKSGALCVSARVTGA